MEKIKILIADDEEMLRDIYELILEGNFNCEIHKVSNGEEAIERLKNDNTFHVIITDYNMPKVNGAALFKFNVGSQNLPMLIFSGGDLEDYSDLIDFQKANPHNKFISKPFDDTELVKTIQSIFSNAPTESKTLKYSPTDGEYVKVNLMHFLKYNQTSAEVFLDLHEKKLTKITDPNLSLEDNNKTLEHYLNKNISNVFIKKDLYLKFILDNINLLKKNLESKSHPIEIIKIAGMQFHISISGLQSIGISPIQIEKVTELIDETIKEITKDTECFKNFKLICDEEGFLIGHSILIMIIAGTICKDVQIDFASAMRKICLAAFFHDFSLDENDLSSKELKIYEIENEKIFQKIINHPANSANFLPNTKEILDDTKRIILEHHEMPNGDGYPKKLNANQISPLSALFIISQQITFCLLRNDFNNTRLKDFIKNNEIIFKQGNFSKFYIIAAKKFAQH